MSAVPLMDKNAGLLSVAPKVEVAQTAYPSMVDRLKSGRFSDAATGSAKTLSKASTRGTVSISISEKTDRKVSACSMVTTLKKSLIQVLLEKTWPLFPHIKDLLMIQLVTSRINPVNPLNDRERLN